MKTFFISGIDTDIGKTAVTGMMARFLRRKGVNAITLKLIQTGNEESSEDIVEHRRIMGTGLLPEDREGLTAPQIFRFPASPHLAAKLEHRTIDFDRIDRAVAELERRFDLVLVEGAGGLAVPLTPDLLAADFAAQRNWPLILVASGRLGSLNHTILSIEFAVAHRLALRGVVYNYCASADPVIEADSEEMIRYFLRKYHQPEVLVRAPRLPGEEADFSLLFPEVEK